MMIDGPRMDRIRLLTSILKQMQAVSAQVTAARDDLQYDRYQHSARAGPLSLCAGALAECALALQAFVDEQPTSAPADAPR